MNIDFSGLLFFGMLAYIAWSITIGECGLFHSRKDIMRNQRAKNVRRGITMRPNWKYRNNSGNICTSMTGRERDCSCGGRPENHPSLIQETGKVNGEK